MTNLSDLLTKYGDTCVALDRVVTAVEDAGTIPPSVKLTISTVRKRKANLEKQITALFEAGARAEREACLKVVEGERLEDEPDNDEDRAYNQAIDHVLAAIRNQQETEGKDDESKTTR